MDGRSGKSSDATGPSHRGRHLDLGSPVLAYGTDEPNAPAHNRANETLLLATVAKCAAGGIDSAAEGRLGDDAPMPNRADQIVFADYPVAIANHVLQQVEHLRFDGKQFIAATKFAPVAVKRKILENVQHLRRSKSRDRLSLL